MGSCFSKKKKEKGDPSSSPRARGGRKGQKTAAASGSRDPPPTESPQEEEKVKEVLSETPNITGQNSSNIKNKESNGSLRDATVDRSEVSEEFSAASTALTETTRGVAEDDENGEEIEVRPAVTRSESPAKLQKKINRSDFSARESHHRQAQADAGKREIRGVDVEFPSARSSPSPARVRAREKTRNRISSSTAAAAAAAVAVAGGGGHNNYNNYKREMGERSGRKSLSPAMKSSVAAAPPAPVMDKRQCRSSSTNNLSASTASTVTTTRAINGRFSPQRVPPARVLQLEDGRRRRDGNNGGGLDGNILLEAKEISLDENPLVSMECFIFL